MLVRAAFLLHEKCSRNQFSVKLATKLEQLALSDTRGFVSVLGSSQGLDQLYVLIDKSDLMLGKSAIILRFAIGLG